jgi:hypothetical protein
MLESSDDLVSVVVLEAGAGWPAWLAEYQRLAPNAVVIAQTRAEAPAAFRGRVVHRINEATSAGRARVRVGVIVAGDETGDALLSLREDVARSILKVMPPEREAEMVLAGSGHDDDDSRHELFALAGSLCQELGGSNVSVKVRFTNGKGGVLRALAKPADDKGIAEGGN